MKVLIINSKAHGPQRVLIDDSDFVEVIRHRWYLRKKPKTFYAVKEAERGKDGKRKRVALHNFLLGKQKAGIEVDHIDRNGLNCQRRNLRLCTRHQNCQNRSKRKLAASKYHGVSIHSKDKKTGENKYWAASIRINGVSTGTKIFPFTKAGEKLAAKHYDMLSKKHFGKFGNINFK